ncbi:MAG: diphthine--ammonia ligase, partial [Anaerolineales bacterium]|nr:diphthine--ammonia ligase [Anaerolineales bacterium]
PMIQRQTTWEGYEQAFREVMQQLREAGVEGLITGDMDVVEHRKWVENMCSEFGFKPLLPLWGLTREEVLGGFIDNGFKAVTVCVKAEALGSEWLGREIDRPFMSDLKIISKKSGVDICGENGEYHTYVFDGPIFRKRISPVYGGHTWRDGYGFLDIDRAELMEKVVE